MEESLLPPPLLPQNLSVSSENLDQFSLSNVPTTNITKDSAESSPSRTLESDDVDSKLGSTSSLSTYIGFSAQSASIPSISCNTAETLLTSPSPSSMQQSASSFTASSTSS